jgi:hypothetical protein
MTSWIKPIINSLSTYIIIACYFYPLNFLFFYWTREKVGLTWSLLVTMFGLILDMSEVLKAKSNLRVKRESVNNCYWIGSNIKFILVTTPFSYTKITSFSCFMASNLIFIFSLKDPNWSKTKDFFTFQTYRNTMPKFLLVFSYNSHPIWSR